MSKSRIGSVIYGLITVVSAHSLILIEPLELMTRESVFKVLPNLRSRANS
jgi:hypothetical protein